ncbi:MULTISPECIES: hypothetical protein [Shewanella]|uniref:hypothetical protein n=1 Tax=Shewanella TaxID=22 RepID=UPI000B348A1E|nr:MULTISPECIES: hypothetical protein [Shewanella]AYV11399.1 hypothetical protein EEY24_00045 [Shewanella algae]QXN27529.1 hypothetical protein KVP08_022835 [Shewanella putrefaciens]
MANSKQELNETLAKSLVNLGTIETMSIVSRFLLSIAFNQNVSFDLNCSLGKLQVTPALANTVDGQEMSESENHSG